MRQRIPTIRSLITLIARRATGVSAKRRRFTGVGFGTRLFAGVDPDRDPLPGIPDREKLGVENGARFDPAPAVRRPLRPANKFVANSRKRDGREKEEDTPSTRRVAPRTLSRMFMISSLRWCDGTLMSRNADVARLAAKTKRHSVHRAVVGSFTFLKFRTLAISRPQLTPRFACDLRHVACPPYPHRILLQHPNRKAHLFLLHYEFVVDNRSQRSLQVFLPHPAFDSRVAVRQSQRLIHVRSKRDRMEHFHCISQSISKVDSEGIALPCVLHYVHVLLHQLQHAGRAESLGHCAHDRAASRTLLWAFTSSQRNQVHRSEHFHFFRGVLGQHSLRRPNIDRRPESLADELHEIVAAVQMAEPAANLFFHQLEPFRLNLRCYALQHFPIAGKLHIGESAIAFHEQHSDRHEIVPQRMRQESQQMKIELSLVSHGKSALTAGFHPLRKRSSR